MKRNVVEILIAIVDNYIMPLPNRNPKEGKDDFISRCMGDSKMNSEFPESSRDTRSVKDRILKEKS